MQLKVEGEETEVDKNIIEHISDPLMYLIRNALDHGIEMPETRCDSQILATDISSKVLKKAVDGVYSNNSLEVIPSLWKLNYFKKLEQEKSEIKDKIKKEVIFRKFNLMEGTFPFKKSFILFFAEM